MAVVRHGQPRGLGGLGLVLAELLLLLRVRTLGVDDLEDPAAEDVQRLGVVVLREIQQTHHRLVDDTPIQVIGQRVERPDDDLGLVDHQATVGQRGAH